jgi:hypothetical protein
MYLKYLATLYNIHFKHLYRYMNGREILNILSLSKLSEAVFVMSLEAPK